jgi:ABC-type dipeptide/oligopeptide/nickel transport system permease subunit
MRDKKEDYGRSPSWYAWQRLKKNRTAFASLLFIFLCFFIAVSGYEFLPDDSPNANRQHVELETLPPGSNVTMLLIPTPKHVSSWAYFRGMFFGMPEQYKEVPIQGIRYGEDSVYVRPYYSESASDQVAYSYDEIFPHPVPVSEQKVLAQKRLAERTYWLGTDRYGRDMLSRLLLGTRISLAVGLISVIISLIVGIILGALAGFFRGKVDAFIRWLINVVWSIPTFLLVMAISLVLGRGFWQVFVAVGLTMWVEVARIVRGQILSTRELDYVQAGRALGFRSGRLIYKHILPNIIGPVLVIAAANFASAILLEAGLSFLGLGVQPPAPSWGMMINDHYGYIVVDAAYLAILPGLAIMLLVLAFNLLGNGLRDALDVKMK